MITKPTPCRQVRLALGLTQKEFAAQIQVAKQTIVDIEGRRGTYAERIPQGLARRIAVISGAHPNSLVLQDGRATSSEMVEGRYEPYSERHAALWKALAEERDPREDGPHPLIWDAIWTIGSALVAADAQGPLRAAVLWEELRDVVEKQRKPVSGRTGLSLGAAMATHLAQRAKLRRETPTSGLDELNPLTLIKLSDQEDGDRLITLSGIARTLAGLASSANSPKEAKALVQAEQLLRQRGRSLLKGKPRNLKSKRSLTNETTKAPKANSRRTTVPKRRR
jgi:DNA-binding XRE family transcriptional regulator